LLLVFILEKHMTKPTQKHLWLLLLTILTIPSIVTIALADCNKDKAVLDVTLEDERYLEYLCYENRFDSATVSYTFGEVRLIHDGKERKILLTSFADEFRKHEGDTSQGVDKVLQALGRTETFQISNGDNVQFYRELRAQAPCNFGDGKGSGGGQNGNWTDGYWFVGTNRILDRTEFVLQIVRESDGVILGILDSVLVLPNPATRWAPRYGTDPDALNHTRSVNIGSIPQGTPVYLRVSPRRFGPTPLGMLMNKIDSWVSLSTLYERGPTGISRCKAADFDSLKSMLVQKVIAFADSSMLTTGRLPYNGRQVTLGAAGRALYNQRYLVIDTIVEGRTLYHVKDSATFATQYWNNSLYSRSGTPNPYNSVAITSVTPNPVSGTAVGVTISAPSGASLQLELYDIAGRKILQLWSGNTTEGTIEVDTEKVYNGTYMLVLSTSDGTRLDAAQLVVQR
jgi:hypothetical protein